MLLYVVFCHLRSPEFSPVSDDQGQNFAFTNPKQHSSRILLVSSAVHCRFSYSPLLTITLTVSDFIESFSGLFVTRYLTTNTLIRGPYCTTQAVGLIIGVLGSAIWTFVITVNTFLLLAGGRNIRAWVIEKSNSGWERWVLCFVLWLFILISGLFGFIEPLDPAKGPYCMTLNAS